MEANPKLKRRKVKGQSGGIDALIIIAVIIAVAAIIAWAFMGMGSTAAEQLQAQVKATVGGNVTTVEVQVLNGKLSGLYIQVWPQDQLPSDKPINGTCYVSGTDGLQSVDSTNLTLYKGQSAVCYFALSVIPGQQYSYLIIGQDGRGKTVQLVRGTFTAGVT